MSILGAAGVIYMAVLIVLLIIGFGLVGLKVINYIFTIDIPEKANKNIVDSGINKTEVKKWLKIALYSFLGLFLSVLILAVLNSGSASSTHM